MKIHIIDEPAEPEDNQRHPPGQHLRITTSRKYSVTSRNDVGGTMPVPRGQYAVIVLRSWFDYETGNRYVGQLVEQAAVDAMAKAGRTPYGPKVSDWDPSVVYFSDEEVTQ